MKKKTIAFITVSYILNLIGFGGIIFLNYNFKEIFTSPLAMSLFFIGSLGPGILGIILSKESIFKRDNFKLLGLLLTFILILIHVTLYKIIGGMERNSIYSIPLSMIVATIAFGLQEIGWSKNVYEYFLPSKGIIKSSIIVGLFKTLGFLPLVLLPGFIIKSDSFAFFGMLLVGIAFLSTLLKEITKSFFYSILLVGIIYGIMINMNFSQGLNMVVIGFLEGIILFGAQDFISKNLSEKYF